MEFGHYFRSAIFLLLVAENSAFAGEFVNGILPELILHFNSIAEKIAKEMSFPFFDNELQLPDNSFDIQYGDFKGELKVV